MEQTGKGKYVVHIRILYYDSMMVYKSLNSSIKLKDKSIKNNYSYNNFLIVCTKEVNYNIKNIKCGKGVNG